MIGIGDKVVCLFDGWRLAFNDESPKIDRIYTVRDVVEGRNDIYLRLEEINNPSRPDSITGRIMEEAFFIDGFRRVTETKTDISIFLKMDRDTFKRQKTDALQ